MSSVDPLDIPDPITQAADKAAFLKSRDLEKEMTALRCATTKNKCGSDAWALGTACRCSNCQRWMVYKIGYNTAQVRHLTTTLYKVKKAVEEIERASRPRAVGYEWSGDPEIHAAAKKAIEVAEEAFEYD